MIAFNKPIKVHSVCQKYSDTDTLQNFLQSTRAELLKVNTRELNRGLLNRLDYETSGILIYAKSDLIYKKLREDFEHSFKQKSYIAIVKGNCSLGGELVDYLDISKSKVSIGDATTKAVLEIDSSSYRPENDTTVLSISLKTGHRHQIRVQLASRGFPIIGDTLYGDTDAKRLHLHAYKYVLELNGQEIIAKADCELI